jgi:hypothetical protein
VKPKPDNGKRRILIYFPDEAAETYRNHKVNKAINLINNIIKLIFKNNKDSSALTIFNQAGNNPNSYLDLSRISEI